MATNPISKIKLPNNTEYTIKDNSKERSQHNHLFEDIKPIISKTYASTSYYATATNYDTSTWYFFNVKPDGWYKPWTIKFKIHTFCPAYERVDSITEAIISGRADSTIYHNWNETYNAAHYYTMCRPLKQAGFNAGLGHAVGVSIYAGTDYTNSAYYRTFVVELYETENCTVTALDTPVLWANWTNGTTTNYNNQVTYNAASRGLYESGDSDTIDNALVYFGAKTGSIGIWAGSLFMEDSNGTYQNICTASDGTVTSSNRTVNKTKKANPNGFKVGSNIYYSTTNYNANTNISGWAVVHSMHGNVFDSRYSFNTELVANSLTPYEPVYLVGTIKSDGLYYLDEIWWTQTPTSGNKVYVLIGGVYDSTTSYCRIVLYENNPWYKYDGNKLVRYVDGVTQISTGAGLTGGPIVTTGTIKANLTSETKLTNAAADGTETAGRVYPVRLDKDGKLAVNVPWTNSNGNYLTGVTTTGSGNAITAVEKNGQSLTFTKGTTFLTAHRTYTQFTGNPTSNQTPAFGSTFTIQQISQATTGQVSGTDKTVTIPGTIAANDTKGLIKPWRNHTKASTGPTAGSDATAVAVNAISSTAGKYYAVEIDSDGRLFANVPWTDTNTHHQAKLIVGATSTATANAAVTANSIYANVIENSSVRSSNNIVGGGSVTVSSDANGKITITGTKSGTVTSITPGNGLLNGTGTSAITTSGTLNINYGTSASEINGEGGAAGTANTVSRSDHVHKIEIDEGTNNGEISIAGVTVKPKGIAALAYKASLVASDIPNLAWSKITSGKPTTLSGYGITDAKIDAGVITLGSNTIKPVTSVNGHTGSVVNVTAADLGLASALKYVGAVSSLPAATNATTYSTYNNGDVITVNYKEYAYVKGTSASNSSWTELGDEGSYKTKQVEVTSATAETSTATTFVYSVTQNANGVITVKTRPLPTYNNYSLPVAKYNTLGGLKPAYTSTNAATLTTTAATNTDTPTIAAKTNMTGKYYAVEADKNGVAYVNVPWTDNNTTYSAGTGISLSGTTFSNSGVTGVKGNSESNFRTGQVNITPANIGAVSKNDTLMTTNPFAPNSLKGPYISKIDNALYAADKRWNVTATGSYSNNLANLFDGSYETQVIISNGNTVVITIDFSNESNGYFPGYPYGYFYISHYHVSGPSSIAGRVYCNYEAHGIGWHDISFSPISDNTTSAITYVGYNGYFNISKVEFTIVGSTSNSAGNTKISQIELKLDRPDSTRAPFLSKYGPEQLYYNLTAPNFIGNVIGNVTGNVSGTASNITGTVAIANGGTGKTTALDAANALISGLPIWTANPTDDTYLIRRDTGGTTTFGQAKFSTVWNYIKGKADSTYSASGHNHDSAYVKKADGVTAVTWDSTNKKITRTINGTAADVVTFEGTAPITVTGAANKLTIAHSGNSGYKHIPSGGSSGQFLGWDSDGTAKWVANPNTDTKVTSVGNHYTPAADTNSALSASASGATAAWSIDVVKAVQLQRDAKGHVTGVTVTSGKIPANPNTDTKVNVTARGTTKAYLLATSTSPTTSAQSVTALAETGVYLDTAGELVATKFTGVLNGTANIANKLGTADKGSGTKPIYLAAGVPTECSTYAGGTAVTLNGASKAASTASFYAPTSAGNNTQALVGGTPTWTNISPSISIGAGTGSAAPTVNVSVLGQSGTVQSITTASTAVYGVTKLQDGVSSDSTVLAATAKAAKTASTSATHTLATTTKFFVTGCTSSTTNTAGDDFDTGVYVTTTAGEFSAMRHSYNVAGAERAYTYYNMTDQSIDFIFV